MRDAPLIAITHVPPRTLEKGERTYVGRAPIDFSLALRQHGQYCALLGACGARVTTLDANAAHADAVFVEDTAIVLDEIAVMTSPGAVSRRPEIAGIEPELRKYRRVARVELPGTIDGGDVVVVGKRIFVGASARSNEAGARSLQTIVAQFGYHVDRVGLRDCLHLKSACCALPDGRLLVNPAWLEGDALRDFTHVAIDPSEPFAADFATVGDTIIMSDTNPRTAAMVRQLGFTVRATPLSEFEKAEGGVTCLSIIFHAKPEVNDNATQRG